MTFIPRCLACLPLLFACQQSTGGAPQDAPLQTASPAGRAGDDTAPAPGAAAPAGAQAAAVPQGLRGAPPPAVSPDSVKLTPPHAVVGQTITVTFDLPGPDGCYRQSKVETKVNGTRISHAYRTWSEGGEQGCTEAEVHGGFSTGLQVINPGAYNGEIFRDQALVARYTFNAVADPVAKEAPPNDRSLYVSARILPESSEGAKRGRAVVSRSVEAGAAQYPWTLRLDPDNVLVAGVNNQGNKITICRSPRPLGWDRWTRVGMGYDGKSLSLFVEGETVARCKAPGAIQNQGGDLVIGAAKNVPNPGPDGPYHMPFVGHIEAVRISAL